jgi:hypothetical protein
VLQTRLHSFVSIQKLSTNPKTNLKFNNAQTNLTSFQAFEMGIEKEPWVIQIQCEQ